MNFLAIVMIFSLCLLKTASFSTFYHHQILKRSIFFLASSTIPIHDELTSATSSSSQYEVRGVHCSSCIERIRPLLISLDENILIEGINPTTITIRSNTTITTKQINDLLFERLQTTQYQVTPLLPHPSSSPEAPDSFQFQKTEKKRSSYFKLFAIYCLLFAGSIFPFPANWRKGISLFMGNYYLLFGIMKIFNHSNFIRNYSKYNRFAAKYEWYGKMFPWIEVGLGLYYLFTGRVFLHFQGKRWIDPLASLIVIIISSIGSWNVAKHLQAKEKSNRNKNNNSDDISCACLGTAVKLPVSWITLFEDLLMLIMGISMIAK